jgi:hypothetical protein
MGACVCGCEGAYVGAKLRGCVSAYLRAWMHACVRACVHACVCACMVNSTCNEHSSIVCSYGIEGWGHPWPACLAKLLIVPSIDTCFLLLRGELRFNRRVSFEGK